MQYTRYAGTPCIQIDLRGNPETYFHDVKIIAVADLGGDFSRYWYIDNNPILRANTARLVELYEYGRARGWNE